MRALALVGVLTTAACGLDVGGLGADPASDGTGDATSTDDSATASPDASAIPDAIVTLSVGDSAAAMSETASPPSGGDDGMAPQAGDADALAPSAADSSSGGDAPVVSMPTPAEGGSGDGSTGEAASDAATDAPAASDGSTSCPRASVPAGWRLSLYTVGTGACPASLIAHDVYTEPTIGPTACSCACSVTQAGDCMQGSMTVSGNPDNGPSCATPLFSMDVSGNACLSAPPNSSPASVTTRTQASPLPPQGGACDGTSQVDATQVSTPAALYCDEPMGSPDSVCNVGVPPGFSMCIATSGMASCPAGSPFVNRSVVEDGAMLHCSSCTACSATTTCSNAMISVYDNRGCRNSPVAELPVDGSCDLTTGGTGDFPISAPGVKYSATATTTCAAGSSTASVQLSNPRTICCP